MINFKTLISSILLFGLFISFFISCAEKQKFNQSDEFWYKEILTALSRGDLDSADSSFISLESEHIRSPILKEATLLMIQGHINREEYLLADFYLDKYLLRFGQDSDSEYIKFLKIKAKYLAFQNPKRDQKLIVQTLELINQFKLDYPKSTFIPYVENMKSRLMLSRYYLYQDIISLYDRLDKPKAVKVYKEKNREKWFSEKDIQEPNVFWLKRVFE